MTNRSKLAIVAAIVTLGLASPAFAQSFDSQFGTANVSQWSRGHRGARKLYNMVPSNPAAANPFSAAVNGGGSVGYNQLLKMDQ
jgi:hypothetical protein